MVDVGDSLTPETMHSSVTPNLTKCQAAFKSEFRGIYENVCLDMRRFRDGKLHRPIGGEGIPSPLPRLTRLEENAQNDGRAHRSLETSHSQ